MRWLVCHPGPSFSVADVWRGWVEALRELGEQVATFNLDDRLTFFDLARLETGRTDADGVMEFRKALTREQAITMAADGLLAECYRKWPDVLLVVSAFFTPPALLDILRSRGHRVVLLHTESPYQEDEQLARAAHADVSILNDPTNLDAYRTLGPAWYQPHCYRPTIHHPGPPDPDLAADFAFVGTGFESRIRFLEAMDLDGLDVLLAGQWQQLDGGSPLRKWLAHDIDRCLDNEEAASVYRSARMGLNLYRREADRPELAQGWAMGPREVEMAACQLAFLRDPRPEGDELLPLLPTFGSSEEASELLRWWLAHPRKREDAAASARQAVVDRTFANAARHLLQQLEE